jgi:hypothetical protein
METGSRNTEPSEPDVRGLYLRNAPSVDGDETWEAIGGRVSARKAQARPRLCGPRVAAISLGVLAIVGAASVGVYEAVTRLGGPEQVLVIGDGETTFVETGESVTVTDPAGQSVVLTGDQADLYREIRWMREGLESGSIVLDAETFFDSVPADLAVAASSDADLPSYVGMIASDPYSVLDAVEASLFNPLSATVYLKTSITAEGVSALQDQIVSWPEVQVCTFTSKEDALADLKESFKDHPEVWEGLTSNPLPANFEVILKSGSDIDSFIQQCLALPEVDYASSSQSLSGSDFAILRALFYQTGYAGYASEVSGGPASTSTTAATTVDPASFRTVLHPYHNSYADYLGAYASGLPEVGPSVETAVFPSVLPAYRAEVRPLPETDLEFEPVTRPDSDLVSCYSWMDPEAESYVTNVTGPTPTAHVPRQPLLDADSTQASAQAFLKDHGLWQPDLVGGEVNWVPYESTGPDGIREGWSDYWVVMFDQDPPSDLAAVRGGFPGAIEMLVGSSGQVLRVRWLLLDLTRDGDLRLRPVQEVLTDLDAWTGGSISEEVNDWLVESHPQMAATGVDLGLVRNDYARADDIAARYLVPVYEFAVSPVGAEGLPGIWYVVAAQDTTP